MIVSHRIPIFILIPRIQLKTGILNPNRTPVAQKNTPGYFAPSCCNRIRERFFTGPIPRVSSWPGSVDYGDTGLPGLPGPWAVRGRGIAECGFGVTVGSLPWSDFPVFGRSFFLKKEQRSATLFAGVPNYGAGTLRSLYASTEDIFQAGLKSFSCSCRTADREGRKHNSSVGRRVDGPEGWASKLATKSWTVKRSRVRIDKTR